MERMIILAALILPGAYLGWRLRRSLKQKDGCGGCAGCRPKQGGGSPPAGRPRKCP